MRKDQIQRTGILVLLMVVLLLLLWTSSLWGQGCAMCNTSVANSSLANQAKSTLNRAVLILLVPPVAMFVSIFFLAYRLRDKFRGEASSPASDPSLPVGACPPSSQVQEPRDLKRNLAA